MAEAGAPGPALRPGDVVWVRPEIAVGREQAGRRPALVVAGAGHLEAVDTLAVVVPITTVDRGWPNHVEVIGADLGRHSWAMTEQVRTISRERVVGHAGQVDAVTLAAVRGAHEVDNLYMVDGSFMPAIGAVNPASTIWPTPCASATGCYSVWGGGAGGRIPADRRLRGRR